MKENHFLEYLEKKQLSKFTINQFFSDVRMFFRNYTRLNTLNVQKFLDEQIKSGKDSKTVYAKSLGLRNYAKALNLSLGELTLPKTKRRIDKIETLSMDEVKRLRSWLIGIDGSFGLELMVEKVIIILLNFGLRRSEILNLKVSDFDFGKEKIHVVGKGDKGVFVNMYASKKFDPKKDFQDYLVLRNGVKLNTDTFLVTKKKRVWREIQLYEFYNIIGDVTQRVLNKKINPHAFRHTFATMLLDAGTDIVAVRDALRHESISTTQIYTHVATERIRTEVEKNHPMFN